MQYLSCVRVPPYSSSVRTSDCIRTAWWPLSADPPSMVPHW